MTKSLDNRNWYIRVSELVVEACDAPPSDEHRVLSQAYDLFEFAPYGQRARLADLPCRERFARLLGAGGGESAALALLPTDSAYIVSRGGNGVNLASVMLDGEDDEVAAEAATAGLALLAAFAGALRSARPLAWRGNEIPLASRVAQSGCLH